MTPSNPRRATAAASDGRGQSLCLSSTVSVERIQEGTILPTFIEMDRGTTLSGQLEEQAGPVILINTFTVNADETPQLLKAWAEDAAWMKQQPGFISTQLHRGIGGSCVFLNYAVWESTQHFKRAFTHPEFRAHLGQYPPGATASPHLFQKLAIPGICVA